MPGARTASYLAIPRPGTEPTVEIVRTDNKKRRGDSRPCAPAGVVAGRFQASICPSGKQFPARSLPSAFIERRGQSFDLPRPVAELGPIPAAPYWNNDSRSIFAVVEQTPTRTHELEIVRFMLDPHEFIRVLSLVPEPMQRAPRSSAW